MVDGFVMQLVVSCIQFIIGLLLSIASVYISLRLFDKFTYNIDEWKEFKKGNVAVGILLAGIIISMSLVIESGVSSITRNIIPGISMNAVFIFLAIGLVNLFVSMFAGVFAIYVAIRTLDWITTDIDEMEELKKGNVAVALMMVAVLLAVSFVIKGAVNGITGLIDASDLAALGIF